MSHDILIVVLCVVAGCCEDAERVCGRQGEEGFATRAGCDENARPPPERRQAAGLLHRKRPNFCHLRIRLWRDSPGLFYSDEITCSLKPTLIYDEYHTQ